MRFVRLPVTSTHIAVGGVFGVGFLREYIKSSYANMLIEIQHHHEGADQVVVEEFLAMYTKANLTRRAELLRELKKQSAAVKISKEDRKRLIKAYHKALVKRVALQKIIVAWFVTLPATGLLAAILFFTIRGIMLP